MFNLTARCFSVSSKSAHKSDQKPDVGDGLGMRFSERLWLPATSRVPVKDDTTKVKIACRSKV